MKRVLAWLACLVLVLVGLAAFVPVTFESREETFEIPKGTWERRRAGDLVEILPGEIHLMLGVHDVLLLRNLDDVPQIFGPTVMMPGQSFRLPFGVASTVRALPGAPRRVSRTSQAWPRSRSRRPASAQGSSVGPIRRKAPAVGGGEVASTRPGAGERRGRRSPGGKKAGGGPLGRVVGRAELLGARSAGGLVADVGEVVEAVRRPDPVDRLLGERADLRSGIGARPRRERGVEGLTERGVAWRVVDHRSSALLLSAKHGDLR